MKHTIEWLGRGSIDLFTVGILRKGEPVECTKRIAAEFARNKGFKITGLTTKMPINKKEG